MVSSTQLRKKNKTCQGLLIPIPWMSLLCVLLSFRSSHQPKIRESTYRVMKLLYHAVPPILWIHRDIVCWRWCCSPEGIIEIHKSIFSHGMRSGRILQHVPCLPGRFKQLWGTGQIQPTWQKSMEVHPHSLLAIWVNVVLVRLRS